MVTVWSLPERTIWPWLMSSVRTPPGKVTLLRLAKGSYSVAAWGVQLPVRQVEVKDRK